MKTSLLNFVSSTGLGLCAFIVAPSFAGSAVAATILTDQKLDRVAAGFGLPPVNCPVCTPSTGGSTSNNGTTSGGNPTGPTITLGTGANTITVAVSLPPGAADVLNAALAQAPHL